MGNLNTSIDDLEVKPMSFESLPTMAEMKRERVESNYSNEKNSEKTEQKVTKLIQTLHDNIDVPSYTPTVEELSVNGEVKDEPMEDYLGTKAVSSGDTGEANKTTIHYVHKKSEEAQELDAFKDKKHFELGTFAHEAFLEPSAFEKVKTEPTYSLASNAGVETGIEFYQTLLMEAFSKKDINELPMFEGYSAYKLPDKKVYLEKLKKANPYIMIDEKHAVIIKIIKRNYEKYGSGIFKLLLKSVFPEKSFYHEDEEYGDMLLKCRPDALVFEENCGLNAIVSFKTTAAKSIDKFLYDAASFKYNVKEAFYQRVVSKVTGRKFDTTIMVMLQTVEPFLPAIIVLDDDDMEISRMEMENGLQIIEDIELNGKKPVGFEMYAEEGHQGIITPKLPWWISKAINPSMLAD
jgi:hypothetical protein